MGKHRQLDFLLRYLLDEGRHADSIPPSVLNKWQLFRGLVNVREPKPISADFLAVQDELLQSQILEKGITSLDDLRHVGGNLYLWRGDITTLKADSIVNAANSGMLGCFAPNHACIDNAIHTYAGVQLRLECAEIMKKQGRPEPAGMAKITSAYNLPSRHVIHTVGPIVGFGLTNKDCEQLASCYRSCLKLAADNKLASIAFCCISTGEFRFPQKRAAEIAVRAVRDFLRETSSQIKVIFNVFKESDYDIYNGLLAGH